MVSKRFLSALNPLISPHTQKAMLQTMFSIIYISVVISEYTFPDIRYQLTEIFK